MRRLLTSLAGQVSPAALGYVALVAGCYVGNLVADRLLDGLLTTGELPPVYVPKHRGDQLAGVVVQ